MASSAKQRQKTNQRKSQRTKQKSTSRKSSNVRVLYPHRKTKTKVNYGRVILLGLIIYFIVWSIYPITNRAEQNRELKKLREQLESIEKRNGELKKEVSYLSSDEYVEQQARSLGLSKPDEEVVVVIPQGNHLKAQDIKAEEKEQKIPQASLWERIKGIF